MAQLSRPYQIALAAVAVLGLIWAVALRAHSPNPSEPASVKAPTAATSPPANSSASPSASASAEAKTAAAPTHIYHGAAPGVEGLTRAIAKAHGAVAESQRNVQTQQNNAAALSGEASEQAHTPSAKSSTNLSSQNSQKSVTVAHRTVTHATATKTVTKTHTRTLTKPHKSTSHPGRSAQQVAVEAELSHGKTVMLVFWDPKSSVSREVLLQADALAGGSKGAVAIHAALANQVGLFGKITEVVHVYQTPTILIVNRHGVVSTLTGLTDVFSLRQAVSEAREAKG